MDIENPPVSLGKNERIGDLPNLPEISKNKIDSIARKDCLNKKEIKKRSLNQADTQDSKANNISNVRQTLKAMNGQATTPENERKVRAVRETLGKAVDALPDDVKKTVEAGKEKDGILNDQVANGRLNLNEVESKIVEFETHQRAELNLAIENRLSSKVVPALVGFGIESTSDLQIAMNCDSQSDLITTCGKILKAASPQTERDFKTADMRESIGNLKELEDILIAGFRLQKEDPDFRMEQFRIDPEAAVRMVWMKGEMEEA